MNHNRAPLFDALKNYSKLETISFDVPGHKMGNYVNDMYEFLGENTMKCDINSMSEMDLLSNPISIIKDAQKLMANAYDADNAFFLINGTTSGILAMILSTIKDEDKIILPRNVHKSVISGLILSGGIPIFVHPDIDQDMLIANGVSFETYKSMIDKHSDAKAILLINPTYFGVGSEIKAIIDYAHSKNIIVLIDQAHGAHFPFINEYKCYNASSLGADLVAVSTHKTLGSLSQSSVLLHNNGLVLYEDVMKSVNMLQSTSASYLLMASLDATRRDIVLNGRARFLELVEDVKWARNQINLIDGLEAIDESYINGTSRHFIDPLKITIRVNDLGLNGFDVYTILKKEYGVQLEVAESYTVLAIVSVGDSKETLRQLVDSLKLLALKHKKDKLVLPSLKLDETNIVMSPRLAFHAKKEIVNIDEAINRISVNSIMIYPPGIPLVIPGQIICKSVIELYKFYLKQPTFTLSDNGINKIEVLEECYEF